MDTIDEATLLAKLRRTRLRGLGEPEVYARSRIELVPGFDPEAVVPAQRYVLNDTVDKILEIRSALVELSIDLFALDGALLIRTSDDPDVVIPLLPPIAEESHEPDGRTCLLANDGMHRIWAARSVGSPISIVRVLDVPVEYPYYALALPNGWADVTPLDELPDGFEKKTYRNPDNYKALFRDFNALFPGVQAQRKRSNPSHLSA
ncbi:hypothetical protein [Conexibacter woesei]|uniref:hypothetical protein n=1 Tax=Conexibacter woesei TaxID=191495 RepID=UPI001E50AC0A|nr:hypothetical protein [Conexibacter woesei]